MKTLLTGVLFAASLACCAAQTPGTQNPATQTPATQTPSARLTFALPAHPGSLSFDQGTWEVKELSAKPDGTEFDLRAEDLDLRLHVSFFVWPEQPNLTSEICRDERLKTDAAALAVARDRSTFKSTSGAEVAYVLLIPGTGLTSVRAFVASGDLCADILFSAPGLATPGMAGEMFNSIQFDPHAKPSFQGTFAFAKIEEDHRDYAAAARDYQLALGLAESSDDPVKWRRVATDQLSNSLGVAGDLKQVRTVNQAAIARDPIYPIYYYSLACADAEENDAASARTHLHQAFERRPYTLPGETMPNPAADESFQKLISDATFDTFLKSLNTVPVIKPPPPPKPAPTTKPAPPTRPRPKSKS